MTESGAGRATCLVLYKCVCGAGGGRVHGVAQTPIQEPTPTGPVSLQPCCPKPGFCVNIGLNPTLGVPLPSAKRLGSVLLLGKSGRQAEGGLNLGSLRDEGGPCPRFWPLPCHACGLTVPPSSGSLPPHHHHHHHHGPPRPAQGVNSQRRPPRQLVSHIRGCFHFYSRRETLSKSLSRRRHQSARVALPGGAAATCQVLACRGSGVGVQAAVPASAPNCCHSRTRL